MPRISGVLCAQLNPHLQTATTSAACSASWFDLIRTSMGSTVPSTITDEGLDCRSGKIILREAMQKAAQ